MSTAIDQVRSEYDEVPYTSHAFPQSAPERLAAIAHMFGLPAPDVATARVLELGCSSGGNLIPIAVRHPQSRVLGLDLSGVQVGQGSRRVADLGLTNLELRQMDLAEVDSATLGEFDYIICHGVYSWVPAHVQDAILRICRQNLSADGVAYVSYNVYPGWKAKEIVRDAMLLRGKPRSTPGEQLSFARGMVEFLQQVARKDSVLAKTLEESAPLLKQSQDYYLIHEYLEAFNAPCYFQQFLERAGAHGLGYLAEAEPSTMFVNNYGPQVSEPLLKECGHSQVVLEQYLDFVVNRTFRQTLLVHAGRAGDIRYGLDGSRYKALHFAANLPCMEGETRADESRQEYGQAGQSLFALLPASKLALDALTEAWPETLGHAELLAQVRKRMKKARLAVPRALETQVNQLLEYLVTRGLVQYRLDAVRLDAMGDRIAMDPLLRRAAELARDDVDAGIFNIWHETVALPVIERWLLPELDGSRDRAALVESLQAHVAAGRIAFQRDGKPITDAAGIAASASEHVDAMLARFPQAKLLKA